MRRATLLVLATIAATVAFAPRTGAYVYWTYSGLLDNGANNGAIGRTNLDGTGGDADFITGAGESPCGVAVDASHLYWADPGAGKIGRAKLDGTGVDQSFIAVANSPRGVAVDSNHVYWDHRYADTIGRAKLDGARKNDSFITTASAPSGVAVDARRIYWANPHIGGGEVSNDGAIGRAKLDGTGVKRRFITGLESPHGLAVDGSHIYWANKATAFSTEAGTIGRANLDGTGVNQRFITFPSNDIIPDTPRGVAVDGSHIYWPNENHASIGRANLDGTGVDNEFIITGGFIPGDGTFDTPACGVAVDAGPSNEKFTLGKPKLNKKKGTAKLPVEVPGPGTLELAGKGLRKVTKQVAKLASDPEVKLSVKPKGKAKKKLNRKGKAKVTANVTYTPTGGDPNTASKKIKLVKRR